MDPLVPSRQRDAGLASACASNRQAGNVCVDTVGAALPPLHAERLLGAYCEGSCHFLLGATLPLLRLR